MLALVLAQLLYLRRMTGKTGFRQCWREGDRQGSMRVLVARHTSFEIKVRFALMTHAAHGDIVLRRGAMAGVAILTGDGLVAGPLGLYFRRLCCMALGAVTGGECRLFTRFFSRPPRNCMQRQDGIKQ